MTLSKFFGNGWLGAKIVGGEESYSFLTMTPTSEIPGKMLRRIM